MRITKLELTGFNNSLLASGYPMVSDYEEYRLSEFPVEGDKHYKRAKALAQTAIGEGHDNFLSGIVVTFDLTASIKFWVEFERYHFAQIVSSQSTMHRLANMKLAQSMNRNVDPIIINRLKDLQDKYNTTKTKEDEMALLYSCPVGLELTARVVTNYRQLKTMYEQRHNHKLLEWRKFCNWMVDDLYYFKELCVKDDKRTAFGDDK